MSIFVQSSASFTKIENCSKMTCMAHFEHQFQAMLDRLGTSTYHIALSVGSDPSRVDKILFKKKPVTFEKRLETLRLISESSLVDVDYQTLALWLAKDYLPEEILRGAPPSVQQIIGKEGLEIIAEVEDETRTRRKKP